MSIKYFTTKHYKFNISEKPTSEETTLERQVKNRFAEGRFSQIQKHLSYSEAAEKLLGVRRNGDGRKNQNKRLRMYFLSTVATFGLGFLSNEIIHNPQILQELNDTFNIKKPNLSNNR